MRKSPARPGVIVLCLGVFALGGAIGALLHLLLLAIHGDPILTAVVIGGGLAFTLVLWRLARLHRSIDESAPLARLFVALKEKPPSPRRADGGRDEPPFAPSIRSGDPAPGPDAATPAASPPEPPGSPPPPSRPSPPSESPEAGGIG